MKVLILAIALLLIQGCASPAYVLSPSRSSEETSPTEFKSGTALVPDRARWVVIERAGRDGSVALHYAIQVKNAGEKPVELHLNQVRLRAGDSEIPALYAREDNVVTKEIGPNTTFRITARFVLSASTVAQFSGKSESVELTVPLAAGDILHERLWLWKE